MKVTVLDVVRNLPVSGNWKDVTDMEICISANFVGVHFHRHGKELNPVDMDREYISIGSFVKELHRQVEWVLGE